MEDRKQKKEILGFCSAAGRVGRVFLEEESIAPTL
jgi:hypothetical protein